MTSDRNQHAQTIAPGEPEAPVSGPQRGPAPAEAPAEAPVSGPQPGSAPAEAAVSGPQPGSAPAEAPAEERGHPSAADAPSEEPHARDQRYRASKHPAGDGRPAAEPAAQDHAGPAAERAAQDHGGPAAEPVAQDHAGPAGDHDAALGNELDELTAKAEKADEYLELAQRTKADFENYRKRAIREAAAAQERGVAKLAKELLPAVDNLDRALAAAEAAAPAVDGNGEDAEATLVSGIKLVHAEVIAALARVGIEPYSPTGEVFDPQLHEAVAQQPLEGAIPGTVVEVYQCGYRLGESVLRPARVVVAG